MAGEGDVNVFRPDEGYQEPYTIYDRNKYNAATLLPNEITFFITPYSEGTKTEADTNMERGRQLPDGYQFELEMFGIGYAPGANPTDMDAIDDGAVVEFFIDGRRFIYGKIHDWPAGFGRWGVSTATNQQSWQNGSFLFGCGRWFTGDFVKKWTSQNFSGRIRFPSTPPTTVSAITIYMKLNGKRVRTVG